MFREFEQQIAAIGTKECRSVELKVETQGSGVDGRDCVRVGGSDPSLDVILTFKAERFI